MRAQPIVSLPGVPENSTGPGIAYMPLAPRRRGRCCRNPRPAHDHMRAAVETDLASTETIVGVVDIEVELEKRVDGRVSQYLRIGELLKIGGAAVPLLPLQCGERQQVRLGSTEATVSPSVPCQV